VPVAHAAPRQRRLPRQPATPSAGFPRLPALPPLDQPPLAERQAAAVAQACRLIEAADDEPDLDTPGRACGMSRFHFHRVFKAHTGITPKAYAAARRAERLKQGWRRRRA
jgi:AraC family transcriptional regulator of adaptative response/methylated-DNA-[protein]-cysteine methyltransferase